MSPHCSIAALTVLLLAGGCDRLAAPAKAGREKAADRYVVKRGPMRVTITETATLEAASSVSLRSEIEGRTAILWLIEEGKQVEKGDLLVKLDVSQIRDRLETQEISVERARAAYVSAEKSYEIQLNQNASALEAARNDLEFARMDLEKFDGVPVEGRPKTPDEMGERDQQLREAESNIKLAKEELERARNRLKWTITLHDKKYVTDMDLEADRLSVLKAEEQVRLAENRLTILKRYTLPMKRKELLAKVKEAEAALERTKLRCEAELAQKEADLNSKKRQYELEKSKLDKLRRQVAAGEIHAPSPGLVVYATVGDRRRQTPIEEGTEVRQGQAIIILPDVSTIRAKSSIHESQIEKVAVGQPASIVVDALPGRVFRGHVSRVSVVPDSRQSWFNPDIRLYSTWIEIDEDTTMLKPGQSATVEIEVARLEDVLSVPLQALFRAGKVVYCWVQGKDGRPEVRIVEPGIANQSFAVVEKGLAEGEVVFLRRPEGVQTPDLTEENRKREAAERARARPAEASAPRAAPTDGRPAVGPGSLARRPQRPRGAHRRTPDPKRRAALEALLEAVRERFPEEAAGLTDLRALFRNRELRAKVLADPELRAKMPAFMRSMGRGRRERRAGDGGR